jgi:hypothetical protein
MNKDCTIVINQLGDQSLYLLMDHFFFSFGATAPILALAYLHETLCFTSVY